MASCHEVRRGLPFGKLPIRNIDFDYVCSSIDEATLTELISLYHEILKERDAAQNWISRNGSYHRQSGAQKEKLNRRTPTYETEKYRLHNRLNQLGFVLSPDWRQSGIIPISQTEIVEFIRYHEWLLDLMPRVESDIVDCLPVDTPEALDKLIFLTQLLKDNENFSCDLIAFAIEECTSILKDIYFE